MSKEYIIPMFLPHGGCKKRCVFCNEYSATGFGAFPEEHKLDETFYKYREYFSQKDNIYIAFYGSTFTGLEKNVMKYYLDYAQKKIENGYARGIRFSTSPEEVNENIINILIDYDIDLIELGVQSFNENVLKSSNRPHDLKDVINSIELLEKGKIDFGLHLMTGLPESNYKIEKDSVNKSIKTKAKTMRIHPTVILKNTLLEKKYKECNYQPESLEESIKKVSDFTIMIEKSGKKVIRYGLCLYGEQINNVVAGPYHQSFGDLVKTEISRRLLVNINEPISIPKKLKPQFLGFKKKNNDLINKKNISYYVGENIKISNTEYTFEEAKNKYL